MDFDAAVAALNYVDSCNPFNFFITRPMTYLRKDIDVPAEHCWKVLKFSKEEVLTRVLGLFASFAAALNCGKYVITTLGRGGIYLACRVTNEYEPFEVSPFFLRRRVEGIFSFFLQEVLLASLKGVVDPDRYAECPKTFFYAESALFCVSGDIRQDITAEITTLDSVMKLHTPSEWKKEKAKLKTSGWFKVRFISLELRLPFSEYSKFGTRLVALTPDKLRSITAPQAVKDQWDTFIQRLENHIKAKQEAAQTAFKSTQRPTAKLEDYEIEEAGNTPEVETLKTKLAAWKRVRFTVEA